MTDLAQIGGVIGGAITALGTIAYVFKRRADNEAQRIELEARHSQAILDRLARMELAETMTDKKIEDLTQRATNAESARERLEWELAKARNHTEQLRAALHESSNKVEQLQREADAERRRAARIAEEMTQLKRQLAHGMPAITPLRPPKGR